MAGDRPHSRTKWLMMGNRANIGMKQDRLMRKTLFNPKNPTALEKNRACAVPVNNPKIPRYNPIVGGDRPSPPRWTGVAKKSG